MSLLWIRYPSPDEPLGKHFYDCLTEGDQLVRRLLPTANGDFHRAGIFVRGADVIAVREADDAPLTCSTCPFCAQDTSPNHL